MSAGFFLYLFALLIVRTIYYRLLHSSSIIRYILVSIVEIGLLFLFFSMSPVVATTVPALLLIMALLRWVTETHVATTFGWRTSGMSVPVRFIGFAITVIALAVVFTSRRTPELREYLTSAASVIGLNALIAAAIGMAVVYELENLTTGAFATPSRFLVYVFWVFGAPLPASIVVVGAAALVPLAISPDKDRTAKTRVQLVSVSLAILAGILARKLMGLSPI